jgi:hypothetical protein
MPQSETPGAVHAEQLLYAKLLNRAAIIGITVLVAGFAAYASGLIPAHVPVERLSALWRQPLDAYLAATATPTGWGWLAHIDKGEFASLAGIAVLSGCSVISLAAVIPAYLKRGDAIYAAICVVQIIVLLLAASGALVPGH